MAAKYITAYDGPRRTYVHVLMVEKAIGKRLPIGAVIHHWDEDGRNNTPENLLVCPDQAYHKLIHMRMTAYDSCGHADWVKCWMCQQWGPKESMSSFARKVTPGYYHYSCRKQRGF